MYADWGGGFATPFLILYILIFPGIFIYILYVNRERLFFTSEKFQMSVVSKRKIDKLLEIENSKDLEE